VAHQLLLGGMCALFDKGQEGGMILGEAPIQVRHLAAGERSLWQGFLETSCNATIFHDLDFLDYHPAGRFRFEHLVLSQEGKILAVVPGALVEKDGREIFSSPVGASVGGPALARPPRALQALAMVQALQQYVRDRGLAGMEIVLPPPSWAPHVNEAVGFALFSRGFRLANRWLCQILDLQAAAPPRYESLFHKKRKGFVRASLRKGMSVRSGGADLFPLFLEVFEDTYARHGKQATHSPEEIRHLLQHHPGRIGIHLAMLEGRCAAGVLLFTVRPGVAYTFYICSSTELAAEQGMVLLLAELADRLPETGVRCLDLGPSSWDGNYNAGVTFFKESLGCVAECRDRWSWRTGWTEGPALASQNFFKEEA
jgi:hypothetical protein